MVNNWFMSPDIPCSRHFAMVYVMDHFLSPVVCAKISCDTLKAKFMAVFSFSAYLAGMKFVHNYSYYSEIEFHFVSADQEKAVLKYMISLQWFRSKPGLKKDQLRHNETSDQNDFCFFSIFCCRKCRAS